MLEFGYGVTVMRRTYFAADGSATATRAMTRMDTPSKRAALRALPEGSSVTSAKGSGLPGLPLVGGPCVHLCNQPTGAVCSLLKPICRRQAAEVVWHDLWHESIYASHSCL